MEKEDMQRGTASMIDSARVAISIQNDEMCIYNDELFI